MEKYKQKPHLVVSGELKEKLDTLIEKKGERYEDILWRLINFYTEKKGLK